MEIVKVLFVCLRNRARSQMAEAFLKKTGEGLFIAESAGLEPGELNPLAVEVMKEVGIDISQNPARSVFDLYKQGKLYSYVIAVCDTSSAQRCPLFPGYTVRMEWPFDDPEDFPGTYEERLAKTRALRDQIEQKVREFVSMVLNDPLKKEGIH